MPSLFSHPHSLSFFLHILIETPASLSFLLNPSSQLPSSSHIPSSQSQPHSQTAIHFLLAQYAILLFSSVLIALIFALRPTLDSTGRKVAGALAIYHLAPLARAIWRIWGSGRDVVFGAERVAGVSGGGIVTRLGGPWVHGVLHGIAFLHLAGAFLGGGRRDEEVGARKVN